AGPIGAWHPRTAHQLGLADIQRGDPPDELLAVVRLLQHPALLPVGLRPARPPAGAARQGRKLIRVLKATLKGPRRGSQRPTKRRPHTDQGATTSAGDHARFSPRNGRPRRETSD